MCGWCIVHEQVSNPSKEEFSFTGSFHTYFAASIADVKVGGLDGLKMTDRLAEKDMTNKGDVTIAGPVDACYYDAPKALTLAVRLPAPFLAAHGAGDDRREDASAAGFVEFSAPSPLRVLA